MTGIRAIISLMKRYLILLGFKNESNAEILLLMPNILEWGYDKINLFELHIKSDTVIINYTTTEGKQRDFKFPLAGFKEKYLEQFI